MKDHIDNRAKDWKDTVSDLDLLLAAGVPGTLARRATALTPKTMPSGAAYWVDHLDSIHKPSMDAVREEPDLVGTGLVLCGESGKGKTIMAIQILLHILRSDRLHWVDDSTRSRLMFSILGRFFDWQDLSEMLRRSNSDTPPAGWPLARGCLDGAPIAGEDPYRGPFSGGGVVVIDDVSRERQTEYNRDRLHAILRKRNNDSLLTILTTNFSPDEWADVYGPVLSAFMQRAFIAVEVR